MRKYNLTFKQPNTIVNYNRQKHDRQVQRIQLTAELKTVILYRKTDLAFTALYSRHPT
jgi:hypothetical protein